ncbi:MAG: hypothetical protein EXS67_01385 [Candidatus Margulisbacteria bacterium]|nr:hypothetical protein [Candidatus Margulisiibacteriota bacterium]
MRSVDKSIVISQLTASGATKNGFLNRTLASTTHFHTFTIEDETTLFSLIWHYHKATQLLTPGTWIGGKVYTVGDVAKYMLDHQITFQALASGSLPGTYTPNWFESCVNIYENFNEATFNALVVQLPNNTERKDCPNGTFRIIDGTHRTLVLSYLLLQKKRAFKPISCILAITK